MPASSLFTGRPDHSSPILTPRLSAVGAPLAWVAMDLVPTSAGGAAVYSNGPRAHAALLFVDFLPSPDGQKLYEDLYFGSAQKDYGFKRWYPEKGGTLPQYEEALDSWHKLMKEITRK